MKKLSIQAVLVAAVAFLSGVAHAQFAAPWETPRGTVGTAMDAFDGNKKGSTYRNADGLTEGSGIECSVIATQPISIGGSDGAKIAGATFGGLIGAVLASQRTSNGYVQTGAALAGAFAGGAVGSHLSSSRGDEFILRCGSAIRVVVMEKGTSIVPAEGAQVVLLRQNGRARVVAL